jgi:hypothetical protein
VLVRFAQQFVGRTKSMGQNRDKTQTAISRCVAGTVKV